MYIDWHTNTACSCPIIFIRNSRYLFCSIKLYTCTFRIFPSYIWKLNNLPILYICLSLSNFLSFVTLNQFLVRISLLIFDYFSHFVRKTKFSLIELLRNYSYKYNIMYFSFLLEFIPPVLFSIMKREFKQWWSLIPPISTKWTITSHFNWTHWIQQRPRHMMLEIYLCSKINGCSVFIFRQFFTGQFFLKFAVTKLIDYESLKIKMLLQVWQ